MTAATNRALTMTLERFATPIGRLTLVVDEAERTRAVDWVDHEDRFRRLLRLHYGAEGVRLAERPSASPARRALEAYFEGDLVALDGLDVATAGTEFQRKVWKALRVIPVGRTCSYATLAGAIGRPTAVRAVGLANGSNPVGIVVPCHRVIGADATLTGYGGGLSRKRWLLEHEGALAPALQPPSLPAAAGSLT